jgi:hypothetical protein
MSANAALAIAASLVVLSSQSDTSNDAGDAIREALISIESALLTAEGIETTDSKIPELIVEWGTCVDSFSESYALGREPADVSVQASYGACEYLENAIISSSIRDNSFNEKIKRSLKNYISRKKLQEIPNLLSKILSYRQNGFW